MVLAVRGDETTVRLLWLAAFGDLVALTAVAILASRSDAISWTSDVLLTGFAVIPMIAATQLRPWVCAVIAVPTVILGATDQSPYAMAQLYQFLASGGEIQPLRAVRGVLDADGKVVKRYVGEPDFDAMHKLLGQLLSQSAS